MHPFGQIESPCYLFCIHLPIITIMAERVPTKLLPRKQSSTDQSREGKSSFYLDHHYRKASSGAAHLSLQRQGGRRQTESRGKSRLCLVRNLVVYFHVQFYKSVAKVLGLEAKETAVDEQGRVEVTWQQYVAYLLKTSPEQDVSGLESMCFD